MTRSIRFSVALRALITLLVLVAAAATGLVRSTAAHADSIPADPAAHGYIGFCGVDDKPMTGGSINDKPFVWKAVASQAAQSEAQGANRVATLYAFQPRPNEPASAWNGDTLTATDPYSTPDAPAAQATKLDYSLKDFIDEYPPLVNGLLELRIYFGNSRAATYTDQYPATFIRVTGDRWKVVQGGTLDCSKGKAISTEIGALGSASAAGTPTASAPFGGPSGTGVPKDSHGVPVSASRSAAPSPTAGPEAGASGDPKGARAVDALPAGMTISPNASGTSSGSGSAWVIVLGGVLVIVVAGAGWFVYRRVRS